MLYEVITHSRRAVLRRRGQSAGRGLRSLGGECACYPSAPWADCCRTRAPSRMPSRAGSSQRRPIWSVVAASIRCSKWFVITSYSIHYTKLYEKKDTIASIYEKALHTKTHMLLQGDAGCGKSIFTIKIVQHAIETLIKSADPSSGQNNVKAPILLKATRLKNLTHAILEQHSYNFV